MPLRRLLPSLTLTLLVVAAFNVFLALRVDSVPNALMRSERATPKIDLLFVGNSLMQSGIDTDTIESTLSAPAGTLHATNLGLGSSSPVEHFLLARDAFLHHGSIPYVVYGFYDVQLTRSPDYSWSDLVGNRAMDYSEPALAAALYAPGSLWERLNLSFIGAVPMLREHSQLWKYVELLRRNLQETGLAKARVNEFGRAADFEATDPVVLARLCNHDLQANAPLVPAVTALLQMARDKKSSVLVVEMPMNAQHRRDCYDTDWWKSYRAYVQRQLQAQGVDYLVASDWMTDNYFNDGLHLSTAGSKIFSARMAQALAGRVSPH